MAKSQYEYVKAFETAEKGLLNTWMVIRLDGHSFSKFCIQHDFEKPSDIRCIELMNHAARSVMKVFPEMVLAYGQSDEYSFIFPPKCNVYGRRKSKIVSTCASLFSSAFVFHWATYFPGSKLQHPPSFDGRMICYPTLHNMRDYLCWRQADCHINNLYNTVFWALVLKGGMEQKAAAESLKGTVSGDKHEILFTQFDINYSRLPEVYRKGTTLHWASEEETHVRTTNKAHQPSPDEGRILG
eukprot:CFRG6589T1